MSPPEKSSSTSYIQIHDPEVNVTEIMDAIESRLKSRNISEDDIERISNMRFSPYHSPSLRDFDPSYTANLFEKGISTPKFTNPKLWFLKGPLRWLLTKVVDFYSILDKKLSENRVRAFFQVLNEIVLLKKKQQILSEKLDEFYKEYAEMQYRSSLNHTTRNLYSPLSIRVDFESGVPKESESLLDLIRDVQPVLIYYPSSLGFLEYCNTKNLKYKVVTPFEEDVSLIRRTITEHVSTLVNIPPNHSVLFHANACLFPSSFWEGLLREWKSIEQDTRFVIRLRESHSSSLSPFQDNLPLKVEISELADYLRSLGFHNVIIHERDVWGWINISFSHTMA